ncbi:Multisubunit Na+/H+ antiporter, MnhB subunit [Mesotoga infera]|jgi:multicomponent Na+:H+ antiporter subunit B|uniref:Multisubunit Na+/H+ antiporter, MnhB subunit n=1 Tax=Mesotoga infera TaxID=1236046 RepID=A0A7Z7LE39_9BACT|nr:Na(+)/H(+) antiporter subunit B [Mesotoga infera]SSC12283.1 Multisubunit Na+/H+ antiporter, MnhB subunit [Mesotoga infera]HNS67135.1 MnhB domain-containing protein [Mesotoga infera]
MKRIIAGIIALLFFFTVSIVLNTDSQTVSGVPRYGEFDLSERNSHSYVTKSVNDTLKEVKFGSTIDAETGSANFVTSIVVNYRSFDTLGEVTVLFLSATGVGLLLGGDKKRLLSPIKASPVVKTAAKIVSPLLLILGAYVFTHGHLTPGGGFPGGAIIAAAFLLLVMVDDEKRAPALLKVLEGSMGLAYILLGIGGLLISGSFLQNFLPTGVVGNLFSAGLIPIVYSLIGLKVGAELSGIVDDFVSEGGDNI